MNTSGETPGKGLIFEANIDCIVILYTYIYSILYLKRGVCEIIQ